MAIKIGFNTDQMNETPLETISVPGQQATNPKKSVVEVLFPGRGRTLSYYNDMFDLHPGDWVHVEGKLEGTRGQVTEVSYNFKIKISDYKRVISVADTNVKGQLFMGGSHFIAFDSLALPPHKLRTWFLPPKNEAEE